MNMHGGNTPILGEVQLMASLKASLAECERLRNALRKIQHTKKKNTEWASDTVSRMQSIARHALAGGVQDAEENADENGQEKKEKLNPMQRRVLETIEDRVRKCAYVYSLEGVSLSTLKTLVRRKLLMCNTNPVRRGSIVAMTAKGVGALRTNLSNKRKET